MCGCAAVLLESLEEDDGARRPMPFPDSVLDMILEGKKEADVLSFRNDPAIPATVHTIHHTPTVARTPYIRHPKSAPPNLNPSIINR